MVSFLLILSLPPVVDAFDVDGFRSGMTREDVETKLRPSWRVSEVEPNTLIAFDQLGAARSFNFCAGQLVSMQQEQGKGRHG